MILSSLMTKGFLTKNETNFSDNSNFSNSSDQKAKNSRIAEPLEIENKANSSLLNNPSWLDKKTGYVEVEHKRAANAKVAKVATLDDRPNPDLPATCPFNTGVFAPTGCRFSHDLLMSLMTTGVMPDPQVGCVFKDICGELPGREGPEAPSPMIEDSMPESKPIVGNCESCSAAASWEHERYAGRGLACFHRAYYLGKSGKPSLCSEIRNDCPRRNNGLPLTPSQRR